MGDVSDYGREDAHPRVWSGNEIVSLRAITAMFERRWLPMVATAGLVVVVMAVVALASPRQYTARTLLMVNPGQERVLREGEMVAAPNSERSTGAVESEIEILRASMLAERVVDELNLTNNRHWREALANRSFLGSAKDFLRDLLLPRGNAWANDGAALRARLAAQVADAFSVRRRGSSFVIEVAATSVDPDLAARLANGLAAAYMQAQVESRMQTESQANTWLSRRVAELRAEVRDKEAAVEAYRVETGLLSAEGYSLTEGETSELQAAVLAARANYAQAEARHQQLQQMIDSGGSVETVANVLNSGTIRELRARQADIARREAEMQQRYGDLHPSLQNVRVEREDIDRQIGEEVARISANLGNEVTIARAQLRSLQGSLSGVRGELAANNTALVRLRELEREAAATRTVYEAFLQRSQEIADQGSLGVSQSRLISAAAPPSQRDPPRIPVLLAIVLGLVAGLLVGLLIEMLDDTLNNADDVSRRLDAPLLASVPMLSPTKMKALSESAQHPAGYMVEKPISPFAEALRVLRGSLQFARTDRPVQIVAVTSPMPNEGKTTLSICLARVAALMGQRAILIDCDLRRRSVNDVLGLEPAVGLREVLAAPQGWRGAILRDERTGMDLLPLTSGEVTTLDVFGTEAMRSLLQDLRAHYDLIVLDCAPLLAVAETRTLVGLSDAVTVVARAERTPVRAIKAALTQIEGAGVNAYGIALNCVQPRGATYRDALYFYREAGGYYQD